MRVCPAGGHRFTPTGVGTIFLMPSPAQAQAVHPHGRGDNVAPHSVITTQGGSPPRAWGQFPPRRRRRRRLRFTPTGVGTINHQTRSQSGTTVHPHGRGDNIRSGRTGPSAIGSPPRAWGQSPSYTRGEMVERFTPTGVGTIRTGPLAISLSPVHPHGRGDNSWIGGLVAELLGSPPRAWGQCLVGSDVGGVRRFTPTGVGTIILSASWH